MYFICIFQKSSSPTVVLVQSNLVKNILISGEIASKGFFTGIIYVDHAENDYQLSPGRKGEESAEN